MKDRILRKIHSGRFEVEDILELAKYPSVDTAEQLQTVAKEGGWKRGVSPPEVPLGDWADIVIAYCATGVSSLKLMTSSDYQLHFVLGFLSELGSIEALHLSEEILLSEPNRFLNDEQNGVKMSSTLNAILLSGDAKIQDSTNPTAIREFLHSFLSNEISTASAGAAFCAVRFYGDRASIKLIERYPPLPSHWEQARKVAKRAIVQRLRAE